MTPKETRELEDYLHYRRPWWSKADFDFRPVNALRRFSRRAECGILAIISAGVAAMLLVSQGCHKGCIDAQATYPAEEILLDRHDAYVAADPDLDEPHRASALRTSALMREVYAEAMRPSPDAVQTQDGDPPAKPCAWGSGPCGCTPVHGPCEMPCSGCCPGGCKPAPPPPTQPHED